MPEESRGGKARIDQAKTQTAAATAGVSVADTYNMGIVFKELGYYKRLFITTRMHLTLT